MCNVHRRVEAPTKNYIFVVALRSCLPVIHPNVFMFSMVTLCSLCCMFSDEIPTHAGKAGEGEQGAEEGGATEGRQGYPSEEDQGGPHRTHRSQDKNTID